MNKAENTIKEKYKKMGYNFLHNRGFPDFIFYKVNNNKPDEVVFVEVKSETDRLRHEQKIFREIAKKLNLTYKLEIVNTSCLQTKPYHANPDHATPNQSRPTQPNPNPFQANPIQ